MRTHTHTHTQRDILIVVCVFLSFFFSYAHYKRKGQGPVELTKELTNITKILQFVRLTPPSQLLRKGAETPAAGWWGQ